MRDMVCVCSLWTQRNWRELLARPSYARNRQCITLYEWRCLTHCEQALGDDAPESEVQVSEADIAASAAAKQAQIEQELKDRYRFII